MRKFNSVRKHTLVLVWEGWYVVQFEARQFASYWYWGVPGSGYVNGCNCVTVAVGGCMTYCSDELDGHDMSQHRATP